MNENDRNRVRSAVIRSENTPQGVILPARSSRNIHAADQEWAYNTTGYELYEGYIVAVTDYNSTENRYTIARPTEDGMANIAVVKSSYCANSSTARVEIQFHGAVSLWYSGTAPTVNDTVGSQAGSFNAKIGQTGFSPLETGGSGRCRCRFFSAGKLELDSFVLSNSVSKSWSPATDSYEVVYGSWDDIAEIDATNSFTLAAAAYTTAYGNFSRIEAQLVTSGSNTFGAQARFWVEFGNADDEVVSVSGMGQYKTYDVGSVDFTNALQESVWYEQLNTTAEDGIGTTEISRAVACFSGYPVSGFSDYNVVKYRLVCEITPYTDISYVSADLVAKTYLING